jgi:putative flippase GtrA
VKSLLPSKPRTSGSALLTEAAGATGATGAAATPGPLASFARFVLCGGGVGLLSSGAVALLAATMPWTLANALITVASTILCTELHARFTFGAGRRAEWRQHWQSAGSATAAYVVTCLAMFLLHLAQSAPGVLTEQIVYLSASGLAGIGRFLVLRLFVFAAGRNRPVHRTIRRVPALKGIGGLRTSPRLAVS